MLIRSLLQAKRLLPALPIILLLVSAAPVYGAIDDPEDVIFSGRNAYGEPIWKPYMGDIGYFDATHTVIGGQQVMSISIGLNEPVPINNSSYKLSVFIDSDANGNTGCILPGCTRGTEFRVDADVLMGALDLTRVVTTRIWQLPKTAAEAALFAHENAATRGGYPARLLGSPTFSATTANWIVHVRLDIPAVVLGNTANANISVLSYQPHLSSVNPFQRPDLPNKQGDRAPDFGEFNTATGTVVNNTPMSEWTVIDDPQGDNRTPQGAYVGPDLRQIHYRTIGDRVVLNLVFENDLIQSIWDPNASFIVTFDSDRRLESGQIFMGDSVPTWGGDVAINWLGAPVGAHSFYLSYQSNMTSQHAGFGGPTSGGSGAANDAQWDIIGKLVMLQFPKSLLDVYRTTDLMPGYPVAPAIVERLPAGDNIRLSVRSMVQNTPQENDYTDWFPFRSGAFDTAAGTSLQPLAFTPSKVLHLTEPAESMNASFDIRSVDYEVRAEYLIIKATIGNWIPNDLQFLFELHLDADANINTGYGLLNGGTKVLGSDYLFQVNSFDDLGRAGYGLVFASASAPDLRDSRAWSHDAWLKVHPPPVLAPNGTPGTVTITVPRSEIPLARDRVNAVFRSGRQVAVAGRPPLVAYNDLLPNSGYLRLASFTEKVDALLSATVAGSGGGVINGSSGGLTCSSGTCTRSFPIGTTVTLNATPDGNSLFTGWSGSCTGTDTCTLVMADDRTVTGTFTHVEPVRIPDTTPRYFSTIGAALASIPSGGRATIQMRRVQLLENLLLDRPLSATLKGGYDTSYLQNRAVTPLIGRMTIRRGRLNVENLVVR